jgi:hypothetical protein
LAPSTWTTDVATRQRTSDIGCRQSLCDGRDPTPPNFRCRVDVVDLPIWKESEFGQRQEFDPARKGAADCRHGAGQGIVHRPVGHSGEQPFRAIDYVLRARFRHDRTV